MSKEHLKQLLYSKGIIDNLDTNQFNIPCMNHNETTGRSLSINFDKNIFKCFSSKCNNFKGSINDLCNHLGYTSTIYSQIVTRNTSSNLSVTNLKLFDYSKYLYWNNNDLSYLTKRRISVEILKKNNITNVDFMKRIFMPFTFRNKIYGIIGRSTLTESDKQLILQSYESKYNRSDLFDLSQEELPEDFKYVNYYRANQKYINSANLPKKELIYEPNTNTSNKSLLFITEGILNTLSINELGYDSVAILGSQPSENQIKLIRSISNGRKVVTAFDNDSAGENCKRQFHKLYGSLSPFVILPSNINDMNQLINTYKNIQLEKMVKFFWLYYWQV